MIINTNRCSRTAPVILAWFQYKVNFFDTLSKYTQTSNFMKIHPVGDELFHADGKTVRDDKANSRFSQFRERAFKKTSTRTEFTPSI